MRRSLMLVVGWVAATVAAVGVAWAGVNLVTGRVVEPLPPTLAAPPTSAPPAPAEPDRPTGEVPTEPAPTGAPTVAPVRPSATPSSSPSASPTPAATASPTPASSPTAAPPEAETRSYTLIGGSVVLRFEPGAVTVVSASPAQGFTQKIEGNGTAEVEVEFRSETHRSEVKGTWDGGPRDEVEEEFEDD